MAKRGLAQIRASAGSGKTWRLTSEYIENLAEAAQQGRISAATAQGVLAVTFTNAAAEEMRERVISRLKEDYLAGGAAANNAGEWLDIFLHEPGALNIRTIDSVLSQIVRASALDLRISPDFQIEFDTATLMAPHVELALENARKPGTERNLLIGACKAVIDFDAPKGFGAGSKIQGPLKNVLEDTLCGKFDGLTPLEELKAAYSALPDQAISAASKLIQLAPPIKSIWKNLSDYGAVERFANNDFTKTLPKIANKDAEELFNSAIPDELRTALTDFQKAVERLYSDAEILRRGIVLKPFIDLADHIVKDFQKVQPQMGAAPQSLMPIWASSALATQAGVSEALLRMGTRLTHFLVDEFQDTSAEQWSVLQALVLEALSQGGSFTWVGDVKQSIYAWRGGDSQLFGAPLHDPALTAVAPQPLLTTLDTNWRSQPEIVNHTNAFFKSLATQSGAEEAASVLLGEKSSPELRKEAAARLLDAFSDVVQKCAQAKGSSGFILAEEVGPNSDSPVNPMCEKVCDALLNDIGPRRPWSDVLVLVRRNKQARELSEAMSEAGIPVITENGLLLNENPLVIQTIALLNFLNDPRDEVSFWTLITGSIMASHPLCNFGPESGLGGWAANREMGLAKQFAKDFPEAWKFLLEPFYTRRGRMTAYDTVSEWFSHMEVKKRFPEDTTMLARLLEVIYQAETEGSATIAAFLDHWQSVNGEEKAPAPAKMNAVRIMTIHKAKGLEAPVVIVPGIDFYIKATGKPVICQVGDQTVATKCVAAMGEGYRREIMHQGLEALYLVYVALTRPKEELYLYFPASADSNSKSLKGTIRHLLAAAGMTAPYCSGSRKPPPKGHNMELASRAMPQFPHSGLSPQDPDWEPMKWQPRLKIYHTELATSHLTPRQRGVIIHTCLEYLNFDRDSRAAAEAALASGLSASTIFVPEKERQGILDALLWLMENAPLEEWLERGWREQPLADEEGEIMRADMIVPEPWGVLVVDYKSGEPHSSDEAQIRKYMDTLARSGQFPGTPCGLLIYLDKHCFKKVGSHKTINLSKDLPGMPGALHSPGPESGFSSALPPLP